MTLNELRGLIVFFGLDLDAKGVADDNSQRPLLRTAAEGVTKLQGAIGTIESSTAAAMAGRLPFKYGSASMVYAFNVTHVVEGGQPTR